MGTGEERKGQPLARGGDGHGYPRVVWARVFSQLGRKQEGAHKDMSQRHQKDLGKKVSQQTQRRGTAFQPPTPSLRRRALGQVSSPLLPCGSLTGRIG